MVAGSIAELSKALAEKRLSSVELTDGVLDRIAQHNPALNAFVTVDTDRARAEARAADETRAAGPSRSADRHTDRAQGCTDDRRLAHDVRLADAGKFRRAV
jgi:hypothetical protein